MQSGGDRASNVPARSKQNTRNIPNTVHRNPSSLNNQATSSSSSAKDPFLSRIYEAHNRYRARHGAQPLEPDAAIEAVAERYAQKLVDNSRGGRIQLAHNRAIQGQYGENLYWGSGNVQGQQAVQAWYDEILLYSFERPGFSMKTGHFTQVVWKGSKRVGCGKASGRTGTVVVCNYSPAGNMNMPGWFQRNVLKASAGS